MLHSFLTSALDGGEVSFIPVSHWAEGWVGHRDGQDSAKETSLTHAGLQTPIPQPSSP
jgi:hypothetical protein